MAKDTHLASVNDIETSVNVDAREDQMMFNSMSNEVYRHNMMITENPEEDNC